MADDEMMNFTVYFKSGNVVRLARVTKFEANTELLTLNVEQDTQFNKLIGSLNYADIEAITVTPTVPDCEQQ